MKRILTIVFCACTIAATAQEEYADSTTSNGTNDVFYSFAEGVVGTAPTDNWDIAFEISGVAGSIIINGGSGVELYKTPFTDDEWASFDTAGRSSWPVQFNSLESWSEGAFNRGRADDFDLGWGRYDINTHQVRGDSIFLIKLRNGEWKKVLIVSLAGGKYNFKYANVDGSNEMPVSVNKSDFTGKTFAYYSIKDDLLINREPNKPWDLVFTKYLFPVNMGNTTVYYPVYGVKANKGVEIARREGVDVNSNDTMNLLWDFNITSIGSDWKTYDNQNMVYTIQGDLSFFIKTPLNDMWKMYFTKYVGGAEGLSVFNVTLIRSSVSARPIELGSFNVYPNPAKHTVNLESGTNELISEVQLLDLQGRVVKTIEANSRGLKLEVSDVPQGMYFLLIQSGTQSYSQRITIR